MACSTLTSHEEHQKVHDMVVDSRGAQGLAGWIVLKSIRMRLPLDPESDCAEKPEGSRLGMTSNRRRSNFVDKTVNLP